MRSSTYKRWTLDARLLYETANRMIETSSESPNDDPEFRRGVVTLLEQLVANGTLEYDGYQFIPSEKADRWQRRYEIPIPHKDQVRKEAQIVEQETQKELPPKVETKGQLPTKEEPKKRRGRPPGSKNRPKTPQPTA